MGVNQELSGFRTTEELSLKLRKSSLDHQKVFRTVENEVLPLVTDWAHLESQRLVGVKVGTEIQRVRLSRYLWRAVVVGETFPSAQRQNRFNWQRNGDKLIASIFPEVSSQREGWLSTRYLSEVRGPDPGLTPFQKVCFRLPFPLSDLPASFETDRPWRSFRVDATCAFGKRWKRPKAEVTILLDLLAREFRPLLATGFWKNGWNLMGLRRETLPKTVESDALKRLPTPRISVGSPLTAALIQDAIREWAEAQPVFWAQVRQEKDRIEAALSTVRSQGVALWGHADYTNHYLARSAACRNLGIPVVETQHGAYFGRYEHAFGETCHNPSDIYVGFGENIDTIASINSAAVPGVFFRTAFLKKRPRQPGSPLQAIFGSYYLMDFDECEYPGDEADLIQTEVECLQRLTRDPRFEVSLKLRPRAHGSIYGHLDEATRRKIKIVSPHIKAGQTLISKYDVLVNCHFSSLLLEAGSIGTPVVYVPPTTERNQLRSNFIQAVEQSPNEVRLCNAGDVCDEAFAVAHLPAVEQAFSLQYCRYATPERLRATAASLHQRILSFK